MAGNSSRRWFHPFSTFWFWLLLYAVALGSIWYSVIVSNSPEQFTAQIWLPKNYELIHVPESQKKNLPVFIEGIVREKFGKDVYFNQYDTRTVIFFEQYQKSFEQGRHLIFFESDGYINYVTLSGSWAYQCPGKLSKQYGFTSVAGAEPWGTTAALSDSSEGTFNVYRAASSQVEIATVMLCPASILVIVFGFLYIAIFSDYRKRLKNERWIKEASTAQVG